MEKELKVIEEREIITEEDIDKNNPAYNENREFYVYVHIRLDKMETFYIGKGKGERAYELERNDHHDNISNMYGHAVLIIKDNLTEEEAFELERDTIEDYVFNLGYGIDIKGYDDYDHELPHLTNCTWGGEGTSGMHHSKEAKQKIGEANKEKNKGKKFSEEHKKNLSESHKGKNAGKNHYLYGKHHSEETKKKMSESLKGKQAGKNHYLYGKHHSEETKLKMSKKVICVTTGEIFNSIKKAGNYYNVAKNTISFCCKGKYRHAGKLNGTPLQWKYVKDYNNEFKGILINPITE